MTHRGHALPLMREIIDEDAGDLEDGSFTGTVPLYIQEEIDIPTAILTVWVPAVPDDDHIIFGIDRVGGLGTITSTKGLDEIIALLTRARENMRDIDRDEDRIEDDLRGEVGFQA